MSERKEVKDEMEHLRNSREKQLAFWTRIASAILVGSAIFSMWIIIKVMKYFGVIQ